MCNTIGCPLLDSPKLCAECEWQKNDLQAQLAAANAENKRLNEAFEDLSKSTRNEIDCANEQYAILEQQLKKESESNLKAMADADDTHRRVVTDLQAQLDAANELLAHERKVVQVLADRLVIMHVGCKEVPKNTIKDWTLWANKQARLDNA